MMKDGIKFSKEQVEKDKRDFFCEVLKYHCKGEGKALIAGRLREMTGFNAREIRNMVHQLRLEGEPICSGGSGYWYAEDSEEVANTLIWLKEMIIHLNRVHEALKETKYNMRHEEIKEGKRASYFYK